MTMLDTFQLETINTKDLIQQVNISDLDRQLITENPLYQVLLSKVQTRRLQTDLINAQKWPHVVAGGGYFVDGDPTADGNYWTIQAGIAFPIYQWGSINYQKEESEALGKSLNMELLDLNRELLIHLEKTMIRLEELNNMLELQETRLETLQEAQSLADINYKAGLITNLEYLVTQQRNTTTMITIEETRLEYILNLIEYYLVTNQVQKIKEMGTYTDTSN
jgi:outer membrane protein TolC